MYDSFVHELPFTNAQAVIDRLYETYEKDTARELADHSPSGMIYRGVRDGLCSNDVYDLVLGRAIYNTLNSIS